MAASIYYLYDSLVFPRIFNKVSKETIHLRHYLQLCLSVENKTLSVHAILVKIIHLSLFDKLVAFIFLFSLVNKNMTKSE